ncbi:MAG: hypothetical protein AAF806_08175 [Bacteroidota bacterium]
MSNELTKLIIRGYEKADEQSQQNAPVAEFVVMFNPENFSVGKAMEFDDAQADGETGSEQKFKSVAPREFSYEFLIDGTKASGVLVDVVEQVELFKKTTGFEGKQRRPLFLTISFGTFTIRCVLKKMEVKYTLFRNDGKPVRGVIAATFAEYKTPEQQLKENPEIVSKITRLVEVKDGLTLDALANKSYGEGGKLIELAKANGLNSLKSLGDDLQRLEVPSTDELKRQASNLANQTANNARRGLSNLF